MTWKTIAAVGALGLAAAALPAAAGSDGYRSRSHGAPGYVTAVSRFGNGAISGAVRPARFGDEVRLPGGTWVYCRRSCSETLRVETVDRNEVNGIVSGGLINECGIFGCLEIRYPR